MGCFDRLRALGEAHGVEWCRAGRLRGAPFPHPGRAARMGCGSRRASSEIHAGGWPPASVREAENSSDACCADPDPCGL